MTLLQIKNFVCGKLHLTASTKYDTNNVPMIDSCNAILDDLYGAISWKNLGYLGDYKALDITGSVRIYPIPDYLLNKVVRIEAKLGGSGSNTWRKITMTEINDISDFVFEEQWITGKYSNEYPHGFIYGNNFYLLSGTVAAATSGLRFWFLDFPDALASMDGTTELSLIKTVNTPTGGTMAIGLPRQFHRLLATALVIDYKESNDLPLAGRETLYEQDLQRKLQELSPLSADENFRASLPSSDGSEF